MHVQLEKALCDYLGVSYISLFTNGTIALVTALQALEIKGEVITTPYSFVATSHSLLWNQIKPVFVDINPKTLNIDVNQIEAAITSETTAIMPVHCYGIPCDVDLIEGLAKKYNLKVIYDAAHSFAVERNFKSILNDGDLSVLSFHATKVFNTFEGGAIISSSKEMKAKIDQLKNFGFVNETTVIESGINGKMSEINAAMGLLQLKYMDAILDRRKEIDAKYRSAINDESGLVCVLRNNITRDNYSYFPIIVTDQYGASRDELYEKMRKNNIFARRYFYPLISDFPMYKDFASAKKENLPIASDIANRILCLPIYPDLTDEEQDRIIEVLLKNDRD